jgi:hypothetical protein
MNMHQPFLKEAQERKFEIKEIVIKISHNITNGIYGCIKTQEVKPTSKAAGIKDRQLYITP